MTLQQLFALLGHDVLNDLFALTVANILEFHGPDPLSLVLFGPEDGPYGTGQILGLVVERDDHFHALSQFKLLIGGEPDARAADVVDEHGHGEVFLQRLLGQDGEDGAQFFVHGAQIVRQAVGQGGLRCLGESRHGFRLGAGEKGGEPARGQDAQISFQGRVDSGVSALWNVHDSSFTTYPGRPP